MSDITTPTTTTTEQEQEQEQEQTAKMYPGDYVELGDFVGLQKQIETDGISVDTPGLGGDTALHVAAHKCLLNAAEYLLQKGANPNKANDNGSTPMHKLAASPLARKRELFGRVLKFATLLIANGADATLANQAGMLAVTLAPPFNEGLRELLMKQCHKETILTPERHLSRVIGAGGKNLQGLMKKHGVLVDVVRYEQTDAGVPVVVMGKREPAEACARAIQEIVRRNEEIWEKEQAVIKQKKEEEVALAQRRAQDDTIVEIPVSKKLHPRLLYKDTLQQIEKKFDVAVTVPAAESSDNSVTIKGKQDNVYSAAQYITEDVITKPIPLSSSPPLSAFHHHNNSSSNNKNNNNNQRQQQPQQQQQQQQARRSPREQVAQQQQQQHRITIQRPGSTAKTATTAAATTTKSEKFVPAPANMVRFDVKGSIKSEKRRAYQQKQQHQTTSEQPTTSSTESRHQPPPTTQPPVHPTTPTSTPTPPPTAADFPLGLSPIMAEMTLYPLIRSPAADQTPSPSL